LKANEGKFSRSGIGEKGMHKLAEKIEKMSKLNRLEIWIGYIIRNSVSNQICEEKAVWEKRALSFLWKKLKD